MKEGWLCPKCGTVNAPWVEKCDCVQRDTIPKISNNISHRHVWLCTSKNSAGNYDYDMRNKSTASFHMILTDSIIETVRNSKIFIMINTLNYMKEGRTVSPWIYLENKIANEQKNPIKIKDSFTESITYPVKTNSFIEARTYADILNILKEYKW